MNAFGNGANAFLAMVYGIHAGHYGQQRLRSTNIRSGLVALNVLLAGLQRHAQGLVAFRIYRYADDPSRDQALVIFAAGKESGMRTAITQGHAKALGVANHAIGT